MISIFGVWRSTRVAFKVQLKKLSMQFLRVKKRVKFRHKSKREIKKNDLADF